MNFIPPVDKTEFTARQKKLQKLLKSGINPYQNFFVPEHSIVHFLQYAQNKTTEELLVKKVFCSIAGRILIIRNLGTIKFIQIQDATGKIQLFLENVPSTATLFSESANWDRGDVIGIPKGFLTRSKTNEVTICPVQIILLAKSLLPLPNKFQGLTDIELRYRKRYLDLLLNADSKRVFLERSRILQAIRYFLNQADFLEVSTPILHPILGGAAARPFRTHHLVLKMPLYLRVAPELYLKRLIVGGLPKVYELGRVFRNEGMSTQHNPEFTILEVYQAFANMETMMEFTENLFCHIADAVYQKRTFQFKKHTFELKKPFIKSTMVELVQTQTGIDFLQIKDFAAAETIAKQHNISLLPHENTVGHVLNLFFEKLVQSTLQQPTFVYQYPRSISPFAKLSANNPDFTDRFELFIAGTEYANAFSELNDPFDQQERLEAQLKEQKLGNEEANEVDWDYIESLHYGMPPTGGLGIGIDRLIMFFTNSPSIKDVILFPTLKPNKS